MLGANQVHLIVAFPDRLEQARHELHQAPGLLELLVFLEQGYQLLEAWVERIGLDDLIGQSFGAAGDDLRLCCLAQGLTVLGGDIFDNGRIRELHEQALAKDVVDFVACQVNRSDGLFLPAQLFTGVQQGALNQSPTFCIGCLKVGDNDADVLELASSTQHVGKRARGNVRYGAGTERLSAQNLEIRRHFVEQDERWLFGLEQADPGRLVRRVRPLDPVFLECVRRAKLVGNFAPEVVDRAVTTVEGDYPGGTEGAAGRDVRAVLLAQVRVFGDQACAHYQVSLTAAHRLFEVENRIRRFAGQAFQGPAQQIPHARRDESLLVEGLSVAFGVDKLVQLFNLVADINGQRVWREYAGLLNGFHC